MKTAKALAVILSVACVVGLGGCADRGGPRTAGAYSGAIPSGAIPAGTGVIRDIVPMRSGYDVFRFTIRMNSGAVHTLQHEGRAGFRVGDRVRFRGGMMELM